MKQALSGDSHAYAAVLEETARILRPYLSKRVSNASAREDILQEILISIHKVRHTYDGQRPYFPWMFAIARYRVMDHLRAYYNDKLYNASSLEDAEFISGQDVTETGIAYESIEKEVAKLPKKQAMILQMMHQEGFTAKEVATKTGMKESAVKVAAHRAYKILKGKLAR